MRTRRFSVALAAVVWLAAVSASAQYATDRPGSFLIVPDVDTGITAETFVGFANVSEADVDVSVAFVRGSDCLPCETVLSVGPRGVRTLVVRQTEGDLVELLDIDSFESVLCDGGEGFITAHAQEPDGTPVLSDALIGSATIIDFELDTTRSIPAVSVQRGSIGGDGTRRFDFDGEDLLALPERLTGSFFSLDSEGSRTTVTLTSPTLESDSTICDLTLRDRSGSAILVEPITVELACFARIDLDLPGDIDDSGSIEVDCDRDGDLVGGVVGSIAYSAGTGTVLRPDSSGPSFSGRAAWGRLLDRSTEIGDPIELNLGFDNCPGVPNPDQLDTDGDDIGDACDDDDDGDGVPDDVDAAPLDVFVCIDSDADGCDDCSSGTGVDTKNDGSDLDADSICDDGDNCPTIFNPGQVDADENGVGDACEVVETPTLRPRGKPPGGAVPDRRRGS